MISSLSPLFIGPLAAFKRKVVLPCEALQPVLPARELFTPSGLSEVLVRYGREYPQGDCRAVMSQWSKFFFVATVYVPVAANLLLNRQLPLSLDRLGLVLGMDGLVEALVIPHEGEPVADARAESRLLPLINDTLAPAIMAMAHHTGIAPRALWSNVGHYYEYLMTQLKARPDPPAAVVEGERLMALRQLADGSRNPLYQPIRYVQQENGEIGRVRRVCCIRYLLPGVGYCGNCPLDKARGD
ncbi:siderophore-iron reductase FhuF [Halomonas sp. WWR20]